MGSDTKNLYEPAPERSIGKAPQVNLRDQFPAGETRSFGKPSPRSHPDGFGDRDIKFTERERRLLRKLHVRSKGSRDPFKAAAAEILYALADKTSPHIPMGHGYKVAGKNPIHPRYAAYRNKLAESGPPPLGPNGNPSLLPANGIFDLIAQNNFLLPADYWIIDHHIKGISRYMAGGNIAEGGNGNTLKSAHLIRNLPLRPRSYRLIDNVLDNISTGKAVLSEVGNSPGTLFANCADMLTHRLYNQDFWKSLDVFFSCGNLFGDWKDAEEKFIFGNLHRALPSRAVLILGVNTTTNRQTVENMYQSHYYLQFFMNSFLDAMDTISVSNLDYSALRAERRIVENSNDGSITVEFNILNMKHQKLRLRGGAEITLERGRINVGYIRNNDDNDYIARVGNYGWERVDKFPYRPSDPGLADANYNWHVFAKA